jgi:hypothetical protein
MNRFLPFLLLLLTLIAGCGGSSSSSDPETPNVVFSVDTTAQTTNLKQLNGGTAVSGTNRLTGTATLNGEAVDIEVLANVAYRNGSGPFFGFLNVTLPDDSILSLRMDGTATRDAEGVTEFEAKLAVLGGTGVYENATGEGTFTGYRNAALGSPVHLKITATVN